MAESGMNEIIIWNYCINVFIGMARWPRARCASDPTYVGPVQCCSYTHTRLRSWPFFVFLRTRSRAYLRWSKTRQKCIPMCSFRLLLQRIRIHLWSRNPLLLHCTVVVSIFIIIIVVVIIFIFGSFLHCCYYYIFSVLILHEKNEKTEKITQKFKVLSCIHK